MKKILFVASVVSLAAFFSYAQTSVKSYQTATDSLFSSNSSKIDSSKIDSSKIDSSKIDSSKIDSDRDVLSTLSKLEVSPQLAMSSPDYNVTAGDVYTLAYAVGTTPIQYNIAVDSTYRIRVANLGVLNCKGLTYSQLKSQVDSLVSKNYPMGGVQFVLTSPSVFLVSISGEVRIASEQKAWALSRLSTFVNSQLTDYSSTRNVTIVSADGETKNYDLFKAARMGDFSQDPYLRPGDKIIINKFERKVAVGGAVKRPGTYELLEGENLKELINDYGNGEAPLADLTRIELYRRLSGTEGSGEKSYLTKSDIESNFELLCYDSVYVSSYSEMMPTVFVEGAVKIQSETDSTDASELTASTRFAANFNKGEDYAFFVRRNKDWFTEVSDIQNAYIIRDEKQIPIDLTPILYDSSYYTKITMEANDVLMIPFKQFFVSVAGAVATPGRYPYIPDRTYDYYVGLAGGFTKSMNKNNAVDIVTLDGAKMTKKDYILPESTITARTNTFLYYFNQYAPTITTILTAVSTSLSIYVVTKSLKN